MTLAPVRFRNAPGTLAIADAEGVPIDGPAGSKFILLPDLKSQLLGGVVGTMVFRGVIHGANVPNTSASNGDYYLIDLAGNSQGKTWKVFDVAIYRGSTGQWDQIKLALDRGIDVRLFGAACDGVTVDTAAVQAAYDALPATGGTIYIPDKCCFNLTVLKNNVRIIGESCLKDYTVPLLTAYFVPADRTKPLIQVGNDTGIVRGFRMENATLFGYDGIGYGDCGIYFAGGAFDCRTSRVAVWNFKYNYKFIGGATNPCSLIFIDGFTTQPSPDINSRCFYAQSPAWSGGSYTTAIFLSNGHVNGVDATGAYCIEADGVVIDMSDVYCDVAQGRGILLKETNASTSPMLRCANVYFDHPFANDVLVKVLSSSFKTISSYVWGTVAMTGKLQLADSSLMDILPPASLPDGAELSYPYVYGELRLADANTTVRNGDAKILKAGTRLAVQNVGAGGNVSILAANEIEFGSGQLLGYNWKFDLNSKLMPITPLDIGGIGGGESRVGTIYATTLNTSGALVVGTQILLKNAKAIFFEDTAGFSEPVLTVNAGSNNVGLTAPTLAGSVIIGCRSAGGKVQFTSPLRGDTTKIPVYANNAAAIAGGLSAGDIYRTGADPDHLCIVH